MKNDTGFPREEAEILIEQAYKEDIGNGDITTNATIPKDSQSEGIVFAKQNGIIAGLPLIEMIFSRYGKSLEFNFLVSEGSGIQNGDKVLSLKGSTQEILICERMSLNFLQYLSGIATAANKWTEKLTGTNTKVLDTRKTLPGYRKLAKYAVRLGGGINHRFGLYDRILIKENHIKASGSISQAIRQVRKNFQNRYTIEVEVSSIRELEEALPLKPDWVLLDNMDDNLLVKCAEYAKRIDPEIILEASGNMNLTRAETIRHMPVDYISVGAITHSVEALDFSLLIQS